MGASLRVKEGERCYRFWEAADSELGRWLFRRCFLWEREWVNEVLEFVFRQVVADPKSCSSGTLLGINERKNPHGGIMTEQHRFPLELVCTLFVNGNIVQ